jgi:hypothetical protein
MANRDITLEQLIEAEENGLQTAEEHLLARHEQELETFHDMASRLRATHQQLMKEQNEQGQ